MVNARLFYQDQIYDDGYGVESDTLNNHITSVKNHRDGIDIIAT